MALRRAIPRRPVQPQRRSATSTTAAAPASTPAPTWQDDPIYAQIKAAANQSNASSQASYDDQRRRALINYGYDPAMSGLYGDSSTQAAAQQNPFSTLAQLLHAHTLGVHNLNESLNKANLFYSGYRGTQLGEESRNYLQQQYGAGQALQGTLSSLAQNLLAAQQASQGNVISGGQNAYNNALNFQLQYGLNTGAPAAAPAVTARPASRPRQRNVSAIRSQLLNRRR